MDNMPAAYPSQLVNLSGGTSGITQTLAAMRAFVNAGKVDSNIRMAAINATAFVTPKDQLAEVQALLSWVQNNIRYLQDTYAVETLQTPEATLSLRVGDCDDQSTLLAALLESIGYATRFCVAGYAHPAIYEHVYVQAYLPDASAWLSLDPTEKGPAGWEPPGAQCQAVEVI